jgi:hypothetical protein
LSFLIPIEAAHAADPTSSVPPLTASDCTPIIMYGTRGSGIPLDEHPQHAGKEVGLIYDALAASYPAGTVSMYYNNYAAVPISLDYVQTNWSEYWGSVLPGAALGRADLARIAAACPSSTIIVAGHSQGADVTRRIFTSPPTGLNPAKTKVFLLGDVNFRWNEAGIEKTGKYNKYNGLVPTGLAAGVTIPEPIPALSASWHAESWCHESDLACNVSVGANGDYPHNSYGELDGKAAAWRASQFAGVAASRAIPVARIAETASCVGGLPPSRVNVALSMQRSAPGTSATLRGYWDNETTPAFSVTLNAGATNTQTVELPFNLWQPQLKVLYDDGTGDVRLEEKFVYPAC